jgi:hypothetical protein
MEVINERFMLVSYQSEKRPGSFSLSFFDIMLNKMVGSNLDLPPTVEVHDLKRNPYFEPTTEG